LDCSGFCYLSRSSEKAWAISRRVNGKMSLSSEEGAQQSREMSPGVFRTSRFCRVTSQEPIVLDAAAGCSRDYERIAYAHHLMVLAANMVTSECRLLKEESNTL